MAPEDENDLIEAVVTCEGNLHDPDFSVRFQALLGNLKSILYKSREEELLKVKKIEPWNSVRVTISIPKEAAQKLRLLAQQGSNVLRSLGILTVQVEGDQVISLTLAGQNNEPTEIVLRQSDGPSSSSSAGGSSFPLHFPLPIGPSGPTVPLAILSATSSSSSAFRSPNVVAPAGESIPVLPPKSTSVNSRPSALGGQFPFTSMIHAAQTMQRTDPALQHNNSSSNLSNNNNISENAVNSTNLPNVPTSASPVTQNPQSAFSTPTVNSVVSNSSMNPSLLTQQQGHVKSEQLARFVLQQHERGPSVALQQQTSQAIPQSQSLQLQIVNVNAPPPYPGVNSSNPSGSLLSSSNSFNHHHHQQLNSANTNNVAVSSPSVTYVGAPPPSSSSNVTLVRSVSSPSMSSQPQTLGDNLLLGSLQQQPMSSPLLVNLLQNNEALSPFQNSTSQLQPVQGSNANTMLPPSVEQQKRFILHQQQRKMKRGVSLDGASLGESGAAGIKERDLINPTGSGSSEPISPATITAVGCSSTDSNVFTQFTLPSSSLPSEPRMTVAVSQQRPSSELATTATIIQGRTIIHQGNVRVFNPGQIRAIRLTQANTSSPSTIHFIQGNPVMTTTGGEAMGNCVVLNGPHPVMSTSPQSSSNEQFPASSTILPSATVTSSNQQLQQAGSQEPSVLTSGIRSVDQSSRTSLNPSTKIVVSASSSDPRYISSISNSNKFIPPSQPLSSSSQTHQQQRLSNLPSSVTQQQKRHVVQSHEAKSTPSQHQSRGLTLKSSKEPTPPQSQLTSSGKPRQLLINPLTGHLEPMPSESSSDSDEEEDRRRPQQRRVGPKGVANSWGTIQHRQILATTTTGVTVARVVKSTSLDSPKTSLESEPIKRQQLSQQQQRLMVVPATINAAGPVGNVSKKSREDALSAAKEKDASSPQVTAISLNSGPSGEKIKLRLKLEKSEPISPAYKVDVSFMKKSEKSSISSPSGCGPMSGSSPAPVGSPGEQPRVPPLHISLRGKNAAVVVSSPRREDKDIGGKGTDDDNASFPTYYDGKLSNTIVKVGKRTKLRVKSSGCESDPEGGIRHMKNPAKLSRPKLSKDSIVLSGLDGFAVNWTEGNPDPLKARLDGSIPISLPSQPLIITPVTVTGTNKDLISGSSTSAVVASSIPAPTVKLKKNRRKSESEMISRFPPPPPLSSAPSSVPIQPAIVRSLSKIVEETSEASSLLFKHLSKKEESSELGAPSVSVTVSQTVTTTTTSLTPISLHASSKETMDQVLGTVTTTSVLTLTSTTTGASVTTLSQDVLVTAISNPIPTPMPSLGNSLDVSKDSNTLLITPAESIGPLNIPMLNRENIPKELDLAGTRTNLVVIGIPEGRTTTTPTSKSPKPLPDLLALPSKAVDEKFEPQQLTNSISKEIITPSLHPNMTINKLSVEPSSYNPKIQSTSNDCSINETQKSVVPVNLHQPSSLGSKLPNLSEDKGLSGGKSNASMIYKKSSKSPVSLLSGTGIAKVKINPSTVLRPKIQTPRVSIGTSIDADLPTLIPSPSLRELLEKEKSLDMKKDLPKPAVESNSNRVDIKDPIVDHGEIKNISQNLTVKDQCDNKITPVIEGMSRESQVFEPENIIVPVISHVEALNPKSESISALEIVELSEPLPSTVTPNAPLPFPLVLPKGEDQSGIPGEDSGIDSMDALSEKSPNRGESPARKEIEHYGESHHSVPHYDSGSLMHQQQKLAEYKEMQVEELLQVSKPVLENSDTKSEGGSIPSLLEHVHIPLKEESVDKVTIHTNVDPEVLKKDSPEDSVKVETIIQDLHIVCEPLQESNLTKDEHEDPNNLPDPSIEEPQPKRIKTESENPPDISKEVISERKAVPTVIERGGTPSAEQRISSVDIIESVVTGISEVSSDLGYKSSLSLEEIDQPVSTSTIEADSKDSLQPQVIEPNTEIADLPQQVAQLPTEQFDLPPPFVELASGGSGFLPEIVEDPTVVDALQPEVVEVAPQDSDIEAHVELTAQQANLEPQLDIVTTVGTDSSPEVESITITGADVHQQSNEFDTMKTELDRNTPELIGVAVEIPLQSPEVIELVVDSKNDEPTSTKFEECEQDEFVKAGTDLNADIDENIPTDIKTVDVPVVQLTEEEAKSHESTVEFSSTVTDLPAEVVELRAEGVDLKPKGDEMNSTVMDVDLQIKIDTVNAAETNAIESDILSTNSSSELVSPVELSDVQEMSKESNVKEILSKTVPIQEEKESEVLIEENTEVAKLHTETVDRTLGETIDDNPEAIPQGPLINDTETESRLQDVDVPSVIGNHVDAIQELNQHSKLNLHQVVTKKDNVKVRKAKLENIVAAIGTKNIERQQQAKTEPFDLSFKTEDDGQQQINSEVGILASEEENLVNDTIETSNPPILTEELPASSGNPEIFRGNDLSEILAVHPVKEIGINLAPPEQKEAALIEKFEKEEIQIPDFCTKVSENPVQKESIEHLSPVRLPNPSNPEVVLQPSVCLTTSDTSVLPSECGNKEHQYESINMVPSDKIDPILPSHDLGKIPNAISGKESQSRNDLVGATGSGLLPVLKNIAKSELELEQVKIVVLSKEKPPTLVNYVLNSEIKNTPKSIETVATEAPSIPVDPPPISVVLPARTLVPNKLIQDHQAPGTPRYKPRTKLKPGPSSPGGRRILDGPPKLSKATETDPRPESANPPRLEMRRVEEPLKLDAKHSPSLTISHNSPKIQIHTVAPSQQPAGNVSLASLATAHRSIPNMMQLNKATTATLGQVTANKIPIPTAMSTQSSVPTLSNAIPASLGSIAIPIQANAISTTSGGTGQTVFAIHPNVSLPANLAHLQSHGPSSITVLPGGHKMVPIKLVTIAKQSPNQFQAISLSGCTSNRGSPNILETVNLVKNPGSRSNSPKTIIGNSLQGSTLNLSSMSLSGSGNLHLVPLSIASTGGGTSNPVKVIVSTPIKMQQSMMMKSVMMGQQATTIRVVRPITSLQNSGVIKPVQEGLVRPSNTTPPIRLVTAVSPATVENVTVVPVKSDSVVEKRESMKITESIYKHVDGLEILDSALPLMNEDDLPFEADIIHDEKDLEDVLAGESFETVVRENGIDGLHSAYDIEIENKNFTMNSAESSTGPSNLPIAVFKQSLKGGSNEKLGTSKEPTIEETLMPDSPIPAMRSSSPLFTYGNRTAKNSRPCTRSPSPTESDVHGEDQEIIDSFTRSARSPSQPKLSPQNRPPPENYEAVNEYGSPRKPDLTADQEEDRERTLNQELSIEIPPVELMVMSPSQPQQQTEERKTRSTRSNTRLVSPDITAFRSDTPKLAKFSSKPDPLVFKNSPKPSPTGSLKMLSPTVSGLAITPSSSNRSSPILPNQIANALHTNSVASSAMEKISAHVIANSNSTNSSRINKGTLNKRKRQESDSSSASKDENAEEKVEIDLNSRPGKRRCSENAAELIKVCIGIEDTPKRNTMLIKKMEESKLKEAKMKKAMATLVEENEGDIESVESSLSRGRAGRSSRASSEDRSSSRGSSVQRNSGSSKASSKDEDHFKEQKVSTKAKNRLGKEKQKGNSGRDSPNQNSTGAKKLMKASSGAGRRSNRGALTRDKSPLTPAKTRTNVRKESGATTIGSDRATGTLTATTTISPPETENLRRKTRSCAAVDAPDTDMASMKRRRISKDAKS